MKSIALKTNNSQTIEYLKNELDNLNIEDCCYSCKNFKHFSNIIIHYKGNNELYFINKVSNLLSFLVIFEYEEDFLKNLIFNNYFYFSNYERKNILNNCLNIMVESNNCLNDKLKIINEEFTSFIKTNKNIYLSGFVNFRLKKYFDFLNLIIDEAVNSFIIEKEYQEFISLLKIYINSNKKNTSEINIIYSNDFTILLDENKNIIDYSKDSFNAKFLSDISFSTNDYTLNTLINLLPKKIFIHLIDNNIDEFINTLMLIFEKRVYICNDCSICNLYKTYIKNDKEKSSK